MKVEDLLKLLHEAGLDDKGIKDLLTETIATLPADEPETVKEDEEDEKKEAEKLFGVKL